MDERVPEGCAQPELVVCGTFVALVEIADLVVQRPPPKREGTDAAQLQQREPVVGGPVPEAEWGVRLEGGVLLLGDAHVGVGQHPLRVLPERPHQCLVGVRPQPVVRVGVGDELAGRHPDAAVPGLVDGLAPFGPQVADVRVAPLELLDDGALALRRAAVDHDDLEIVRDGLRLQVLQLAAQKALRMVGGDDGRDPVSPATRRIHGSAPAVPTRNGSGAGGLKRLFSAA